MTTQALTAHIESTPGVCGGRPRVAGRRITVQNIAIWHSRLGQSVEEIATEYDLTLGEVYAALSYYYDHRDEVDAAIEQDRVFVEELRRSTPSKVSEKLRSLQSNGRDD